VQVRVQRSFRQEAGSDTLLRLLHDYIAGCSAVVCVIGKRSGGCPPPAAAAFRAYAAAGYRRSVLYAVGVLFRTGAQARRLSLYLAEPDYQPDKTSRPATTFPGCKKGFVEHIKARGLHYVPFSNRDQLRAEVLKEDWPDKPRAKPIGCLIQPRRPLQGREGPAPAARDPDARQSRHGGDRQQGTPRLAASARPGRG